MIFTLPYPPTANKYWRHPVIHGRARHILSKDARAYRHAVRTSLTAQDIGAPMFVCPLCVILNVYPPDNIRRDLDNIQKPVCDSLEAAGVYLDDRLIKRLVSEMHPAAKPGRIVVEIIEWELRA